MISPGDKFDRYIVETLLGEGGMGRVYCAFDPKLGRRIALKVIDFSPTSVRTSAPTPANPSEGSARMLREARAAAAIDHPNAVSIFDVGEVDGMPFIAMELIEGASLRTYVGKPGLTWDRRLRWLADVARGLAAAHRRGLVHRDIKPENVMVRSDGVVKVLDFGIARRPDHPVDPTGATEQIGLESLTGEGVIVGTPRYMSPEQMRGDPLDGRSDQFAWGVLAFELLTGKPPWHKTDGSLAHVATVLTRDPEPLEVEGLPESVVAVVKRALSRTPEERFTSMDELLQALEPHVIGSTRDLAPPNSSTKTAAARSAETLDTEMVASTPTPRPEAPASLRARDILRRRTRALVLVSVTAVAAVGIALGTSHNFNDAGDAHPATSGSTTVAPKATAVTDLPDPQTSSHEALVAYRSAMQASRDGVGDARARFQHALELDPNLAAAHLRLAYELFWESPNEARQSFTRAEQLRASLSPRDQEFLSAVEPIFLDQPSNEAEGHRRLGLLVTKYPMDAELWYHYGHAESVFNRQEPFGTAVEIDPSYARAWWQLGEDRAYLGDINEARVDFQKCLDVTREATSCLWNRIVIDEVEGRCAQVEADARQWTAVDPQDPLGQFAFAKALYAQGKSLDATHEALLHAEAVARPTDHEHVIEKDAMLVDSLRGDFTSALKHAKQYEALIAGNPGEPEHIPPAREIVEAYLESDQRDLAAQYAEQFLKKRDAWIPSSRLEDFAVAADPTVLMNRALFIGKRIDAAELARRKDAWTTWWREHALKLGVTYVWLNGMARDANTKDEAEHALASATSQDFPAYVPLTAAPAWIGHTYFLAGRVDEAMPYLAKGAAGCQALDLPFDNTRAHFWYGQALEAKGDKVGACNAYSVVLARWGDAKPKSVTADAARARTRALKCAP